MQIEVSIKVRERDDWRELTIAAADLGRIVPADMRSLDQVSEQVVEAVDLVAADVAHQLESLRLEREAAVSAAAEQS